MITKSDLAEKTESGNLLVKPMFTTSAELLFPKTSSLEIVSTVTKSQHGIKLYPLLCASIRADFTAGNPFLRYLSTVSHKGRDYVLFWWSVELIIIQDEMKRWYKTRVSAGDCPYLTSFEAQQPVAQSVAELLQLFVEDGARHRVDLPKLLAHSLGTRLRKGLGQNLLLNAQEHVIEVHHEIQEGMSCSYISIF